MQRRDSPSLILLILFCPDSWCKIKAVNSSYLSKELFIYYSNCLKRYMLTQLLASLIRDYRVIKRHGWPGIHCMVTREGLEFTAMQYKQGVAVARGIWESFFLAMMCTEDEHFAASTTEKRWKNTCICSHAAWPRTCLSSCKMWLCSSLSLSCLRWLRLITQPKHFLKDLRAELKCYLKTSLILSLQHQ